MTTGDQTESEVAAVAEASEQEAAGVRKGQRKLSELKGRLKELKQISGIKSRLHDPYGEGSEHRAADSEIELG